MPNPAQQRADKRQNNFGKVLSVFTGKNPSAFGGLGRRRRRDGYRIPQNSPTYGFDIPKTTIAIGNPIPVIYGRNRVGGQIVQAVSTGSAVINREQLYLLLVLGWGQIESIDQSTLKINNNPLTEFGTIVVTARTGGNFQTQLPNTARNAATTLSGEVLASGVPKEVTTSISNARSVSVKIRFPNGLFGLNFNGAFQLTVNFSYEIRKLSDASLVKSGTFFFSHENRAIMELIATIDGLPGDDQYRVIITRTSPDNSSLPAGYQSDSTFVSISEFGGDIFTYPNMAMLEVAALATDQFNGEIPNVNVEVLGKKVNIWNGASLSVAYSTNPAWIALDILTNKLYGLGRTFDINTSIDLDSFKTWADYCDVTVNGKPRFTFNGVFDSAGERAFEAFLKVCDVGRGIPDLSQGIVSIKINQARDTSGLFTPASILGDSFQLVYKGDDIDAVSLSFFDADNNFTQDAVEYRVGEPKGNSYKVEAISRIGITDKDQAKREARFILLDRVFTRRTISFKTGLEGLSLTNGDRFELSHDTPGWGYGGRLSAVMGSSTTIIVDRDIEVTNGDPVILEHYETGVLFETSVASATGPIAKGGTLTLNGAAPSLFPKYSQYAVGTYKPFVVTRVSCNPDLEVDIEAEEYIAGIYDESAQLIDAPDYVNLPIKGQSPEDVINLAGFQTTRATEEGTKFLTLDVYWSTVDFDPTVGKPRAYLYEVYIRPNGEAFWQQAGITRHPEHTFSILGKLIPGTTYEITVVPVSFAGDKKSPDDTASITVLFTGFTTRPDQVQNFSAVCLNQHTVRLTFDPLVDESNIAGYVIRRSSSWQLGQEIVNLTPGTYQYDVDWFHFESQQYMIRAINFNGNYSTDESIAVVECPVVNNVLEHSINTSTPGTKTNVAYDSFRGLVILGTDNVGTYESQVFSYDPGVSANGSVRLEIKKFLDDFDSRDWDDITEDWTSANFALSNSWETDLDEPYPASIVVQIRRNHKVNGWEGYQPRYEFVDFQLNDYDSYQYRVTFTRSTQLFDPQLQEARIIIDKET